MGLGARSARVITAAEIVSELDPIPKATENQPQVPSTNVTAQATLTSPISHDRQPIPLASDAAFIRSPSHGAL
jgi:hypothetical protein